MVSKIKKVPVWVLAFAFFPLGLGGVVLSTTALIHGVQSLKWPAAPGVVLSSHLSARLVGADQPEVRYSYTFNGNPYVSNRLWPGDVISSMPVVLKKDAERLVARFEKGTEVSVYVNPKNPADVALIPGPKKAVRWFAVFLFFLLMGFGKKFTDV